MDSALLRIALLSDIHGNPIALDAVLDDVQAQGGVDAYWVLGDMAAIGHDPNGVLLRLTALPDACFVRGNTDRYVVTGERPPPTFEEAVADPRLRPQFVEVAHSFAWTQGVVTVTGWWEWLAALPLEQRTVLPDGTRLLGVHASPGTDDGHGIHPGLSDTELRLLLTDCAADLVCVGHTHWPLDRNVDGVRVVNLGSVSNPLSPDLRASYVILEADEAGYRLEFRRVDYDHQAVIAAVQRVRHPAAGFIVRHMLGQRQPGNERVWRVGELTGSRDSGTLQSSKTTHIAETGGIMETGKGTIIFLNGASSSGKTVIAKTLQQILDEPYLHFSADSFIDMLPERYTANEEQGDLSPEELEALVGLIPRLVAGFHRCIAMLSVSGVSLIVDHVLQHRQWLQECVDHLAHLPVLFVGVHCPLEELERRERKRDREQGTARKQFDFVHAHGIYDVEVDTSVCSPMDCALQIRDALKNMASADAFKQLKEVLASETG